MSFILQYLGHITLVVLFILIVGAGIWAAKNA